MSKDFYYALLIGWSILLLFWTIILIFVYLRKPPKSLVYCPFRGLLCRRVQKSMFVTSLPASIHLSGVTKSADGGYRDRILEHFATNAELWGSQNRYIFTRRKDQHDLA